MTKQEVCDGCWRRGICQDPPTCRCPCNGGATWRHADDPRDNAGDLTVETRRP